MSDAMNSDRNPQKDFLEVISLLEKNLKYIDSLGLNSDVIQDYRKIIVYLKARNKSEIDDILGTRAVGKKLVKKIEISMTDIEIKGLTNNQIKELLDSPNMTRKVLERVAALRFSVSRGALSSLRTNEALRDKIMTLISNEGAHDSIRRIVTGQDTTEDKK